MSDLVEVGDVIVTTSALDGVHRFPITRVTKTLAKSKRKDGYEHTFKRFISSDMSHPARMWNTTEYSVEKLEEKGDE